MQVVNAATAIQANPAAVLDMLDMFEEFATDAVLETGGAWIPYKAGTEFLIARDGNTEYSDMISKTLQEYSVKLEKGDDEAKKLSEDLMLKVIATTILKGWKNVKYKGTVLEYSVDNAVTMLRHSDFRAWVKRQSLDRDHYKAKLVEEQAKN